MVYKMLGKPEKGGENDCNFQLQNSNLFSKKCLLPMHAVCVEDVADEIQSYDGSLHKVAFLNRLVCLHEILLKYRAHEGYYVHVPLKRTILKEDTKIFKITIST